ncbi:hypothetical protein BH09VER1_BH09VER1_46880 [soil metagenome]
MNISRPRFRINPHLSRLGVAAASLTCIASVFSQEVQQPPQVTEVPQQQQNAIPALSQQDLNQLLAPIALYPDALIALILPASTVPSDVVLASRFLTAHGDANQISGQPWDPSVQSLATYPDVVTWMDQNLEWTTNLGQAFITQPADVMNTIQQLRAQAKAAGNLVDTPQQKVVVEDQVIRIIPEEPAYIYPPQYDPEVVYVQQYSQDVGPLVTFGVGFAVGSWLNYDCDWNDQRIYRGDWQPGWNYDHHGNGGGHHGNNNVNVVNINQSTAQVWHPSARSRQQLVQQQQRLDRTSNVQTASGIAAVNGNQAARANRAIPRPSRPRFDKHNGGNRNATLQNQQPSATIQPSSATSVNSPSSLSPTTPPNVPGQKGKPLKGPNSVNQTSNSPSNRPGRPQPNAISPNGSPIAPASQAPGTGKPNGSVPPQKGGGKHNTQPSTAPNQVKPAPLTTAPSPSSPNPKGKNDHKGQPNRVTPQTKNQAPVTTAPPVASPSSSNNKGKNNHSGQPNTVAPQTKSPQPQSQSAPAAKPQSSNKHQNSAPQAQSSVPKPAPAAPPKHSAPPKQTSQPAQAPHKQPQPQKQQPQAHNSKPQQPAPASPKHQEQKAQPAPKKQAPAASAPQSHGQKPTDKKNDKKKDDN